MALVRFVWDPHPDPNVIGFTLNIGRSSANYTATQAMSGTSGTYDVVPDGAPYFFALTASTATQTSGLSNEISGRWLPPLGVGLELLIGLTPGLSRGTPLQPRSAIRGT